MNPKSKRPKGPSGRDLGLVAPAGKGDTCRITNAPAFRDNFDAVKWSDRLPPRAGKFVKTYK